MKDKICLFAGTTEGRFLAAQLKDAAELTVCVATEYGEVLLDNIEGIKVHTGRLGQEDMPEFFKENGFCRIIDATHPYAEAVTETICSAAKDADIPVMRILRETEGDIPDAVYVKDAEGARDFLMDKEGNIFLSTGAKELLKYKGLNMERVWARVLPLSSSLDSCSEAGIQPSHIIAAQGPFSYDINLAQLRMINAKYMVTKASGKNGGFDEKIRAARDAKVTPVIIGVPPQVEGYSLDDALLELGKLYELNNRKITIVGIGPGSQGTLTADAKKAVSECDALIGAKSVADAVNCGKPVYYEFLPQQILDILNSHPSIRRACVVMRGDIGFYSGTKKLLESLKGEDVSILPGISSVVIFASKLKTSWDDAKLLSLHGRAGNIIHAVVTNKKIFALTGGDNRPDVIIDKLCRYNLGDVKVAVGENLSLENEHITTGTAKELKNITFDPLSIMYIENENAADHMQVGIPDGEFIRGDVPMTKSEIRALSLSKLALSPDSVVWDVGAGTGSVSIECALAAFNGHVYAIEKETDAVNLIRQNALKFYADNLTVIEGLAPSALEDLPAPTHVFIGGSSGNLEEILTLVLKRNPDAVIVVNAITLETQTEVLECAKKLGFKDFDAVSVNISRSRKAGRYNLMTALNPVIIYFLHGGKICD